MRLRQQRDQWGRLECFLPLAAFFAPVAHTVLPDGRIRFDPVPVYIGPAPGWKGPALGARPTTTGETAVAPGARPISAENASTVAATSDGDASAPVQSSSRSKLKLARHATKRMVAHKPVKSPAPGGAEKTISAEHSSTVATTSRGRRKRTCPSFIQIQAQACPASRKKDGAQAGQECDRKIGE